MWCGTISSAPPAATVIDRSPAARIDRLAATLPAVDAEKLRGEFRRQQAGVDAARDNYRRLQDVIRHTLRAEPFDPVAMRAAMAEARAARQAFDHALQGVVAAAAEQMSVAGRNKLADWPGSRPASEAEPVRTRGHHKAGVRLPPAVIGPRCRSWTDDTRLIAFQCRSTPREGAFEPTRRRSRCQRSGASMRQTMWKRSAFAERSRRLVSIVSGICLMQPLAGCIVGYEKPDPALDIPPATRRPAAAPRTRPCRRSTGGAASARPSSPR